jgi:WD40 repeat protein
VRSAAFSPDGTRIVTASEDNTARVWEASTGKELAQLQGHTAWVRSAAFSPDGTRIVTASEDNTARVWEVHWLTQYHGRELIKAVCQKKLVGASMLTMQDVLAAPLLYGRAYEDVCTMPSLVQRAWAHVQRLWIGFR